MRRSKLILLILCGFLSESLSQTHVYAGGGISALGMHWKGDNVIFFGEEGKGQGASWSYSFSILAKSNVSNNLALSLGVLYNINEFEFMADSWEFNPLSGVFYSRYAIPLRLHWTVYQNVYLSSGIIFNSLYREEYTRLYGGGGEVYEHNRPNLNFTFGAGVEWKRFLLDIAVARNLMEPQMLLQDYYWTFDFNVYYRILSSGKE